jgi:hypothetical protein
MSRRMRGVLGTALTWGAVWPLAALAKVPPLSFLTHFRVSTGVFLLRAVRAPLMHCRYAEQPVRGHWADCDAVEASAARS